MVGSRVGFLEEARLDKVGLVGFCVGTSIGEVVGIPCGVTVGCSGGSTNGLEVELKEYFSLGLSDDSTLGHEEGDTDGAPLIVVGAGIGAGLACWKGEPA
jgi:hypothetical protein